MNKKEKKQYLNLEVPLSKLYIDVGNVETGKKSKIYYYKDKHDIYSIDENGIKQVTSENISCKKLGFGFEDSIGGENNFYVSDYGDWDYNDAQWGWSFENVDYRLNVLRELRRQYQHNSNSSADRNFRDKNVYSVKAHTHTSFILHFLASRVLRDNGKSKAIEFVKVKRILKLKEILDKENVLRHDELIELRRNEMKEKNDSAEAKEQRRLRDEAKKADVQFKTNTFEKML